MVPMNVLNKRNGKDTNIFNPDFTTDQTYLIQILQLIKHI